MPEYYTYKNQVHLKPGEKLGFTSGRGYYAIAAPPPPARPAPLPTAPRKLPVVTPDGDIVTGRYTPPASPTPQPATLAPATPVGPAPAAPAAALPLPQPVAAAAPLPVVTPDGDLIAGRRRASTPRPPP